MRHYVAVLDPATGKWFYANEGRHRETRRYGWTPVGACVDCGGHATAEEAYDHERERRLAEALIFHDDRPDARSQSRCEVPKAVDGESCQAFTSGSAWVSGYWQRNLCAKHRTPDVVASMYRCGESWEA